jgi:ATP-binding cassette subfamily B protein
MHNRKNIAPAKAKNLKVSTYRLIKELSKMKKVIFIALFLGVVSSIFAIISPNILKDLTDQITKGLTINNRNFEKLLEQIQTNHLSNNYSDIEIDGYIVKVSEQVVLLEALKDYDKNTNPQEIYKNIEKLPKSIQEIIKPVMNFDSINKFVIILASLYLISGLFNYIQQLIFVNVSNDFALDLRKRISIKINKLPLKYFDQHQTGDVLSRVTNDVDTVSTSMNDTFSSLVSSIILLLGTILMMFITNWLMAITALFSSLIGFIFMFKILSRTQKYFEARQKELGNLNGHIEEVYSGLIVVKSYNAKDEVGKKFNKLNDRVKEANFKSQFLSGLMMPLMHFIGNFGYVAVCIVGAILVKNNYITFGVIVAFITYVRLFMSPLSQIGQAMNSVQSTVAASERIFEFIDEEEMSSQKDLKKELKTAKGNIEFKNVSFTYSGNKKPTIESFSAKAKSGQKIAIVGPTGAGKTTMVNLLMKFYEINSGDILIDGVSINELTRENVHDLFTMVLQDTWLFNGTIMENIKFNKETISDEEVKRVCKIIGLDHFIKTLPEGYQTVIKDNESVSSGQRQLLTIARGMIEDSPFLILDEATSNVDTRTEELVQSAMDKLTEGRTSFIIAHRLSTIKNADLILVMKDGNIIEQGTHDNLMKQKGFYADLYNSQFVL